MFLKELLFLVALFIYLKILISKELNEHIIIIKQCIGVSIIETTINNPNVGEGLGALKNVPKTILNKLGVTANSGYLNQSEVEVIIISGESVDNISRFVESLGGKYEALDYGFAIVTIPVDKLTQLAANENIQYIELPKSLYTTDEQSNRAACVQRARTSFNIQGEGVLIGFIDSGIDYTHRAFRNEDGTTRIEYIYDISDGGFIYNKAQINEALKSNDPFSIVKSYDLTEHGTHVAGIACAGGNINPEYYGVAPKSSIAMVKCTRGAYALSTNIMRGLKFLIDKGKELRMPLSVNISLSTNDGAHNGTSLLEQYISTVATLERITISIAAGNEGEAAHHVGGNLKEQNRISFNVASDESIVVINLYKPVLPNLKIRIVSPTGATSGDIDIKEGFYEGNIGRDRYQVFDTGPKPFDIIGETVISLVTNAQYLSSGQWDINMTVTNNYDGIFDMWLPISEGLNEKTKFLQPTVLNTLGIPATVSNIIAVGSYNYRTNNISSFSGRGKPVVFAPMRPDLVAPGEGIMSTVPDNRFDVKSGTSMATPHVAGIVALLMQWGIVKGNDPYLYGERLKYHLINAAKRTRIDVTYPDPSWGYGEVCAYDSIELIINILGYMGLRSEESLDKKNTYLDNEWWRDIKKDIIEQFGNSSEQVGFIVEYYSKQKFLEIGKLPNTFAVILDGKFGIVFTPFNKVLDVKSYVREIMPIEIPAIYTLTELSPVDASGANLFYNNPLITLNGKGVVIGIIDTGIDYLNEEFIKEDDTTRILRIWDQTLNGDKDVYAAKFGVEYTDSQINEAIRVSKAGGDPYSIVVSKDEIGHGTMVAGVAGGRGKNPHLIGAAPDCEFAIVKLKPASNAFLNYAGVKPGVGRYTTVDILMGLRYLSKLSADIKKPMIIYIPLGTNTGAHDGTSVIETYIDAISRRLGVICVVGTGNQGDTDTHTEGKFEKPGQIKSLELKVGKTQKNMNFQIFIRQPDRISLGVVSPSGEVIDRIPAKLGKIEKAKFIYEGTDIKITYIYPDYSTGDEIINVELRNLKDGIWQFRLYGDYIVDGQYWSWIPQRNLLDPETKFLNPSQYTTLAIPATSRSALVASFYNQNNNATVGQAGRGFTRDGRVKPDIAAGGINALVTVPGGGTKIASGSSIGSAVLAGCCALLLQWAIVEGNDPSIYATEVRTYIIRGAKMRPGDLYPNEQWGYGILNMKGIFDAIRGNLVGGIGSTRGIDNNDKYEEYNIGKLFIRIPRI